MNPECSELDACCLQLTVEVSALPGPQCLHCPCMRLAWLILALDSEACLLRGVYLGARQAPGVFRSMGCWLHCRLWLLCCLPLTVTLPSAPSARTLCDNLRRERDRAVSELAEALRSLDDTRKQKNDVSRELKELKYAGVGSWEHGVPLPWARQHRVQASPSVPSLCLTLSTCKVCPGVVSMLRGN